MKNIFTVLFTALLLVFSLSACAEKKQEPTATPAATALVEVSESPVPTAEPVQTTVPTALPTPVETLDQTKEAGAAIGTVSGDGALLD